MTLRFRFVPVHERSASFCSGVEVLVLHSSGRVCGLVLTESGLSHSDTLRMFQEWEHHHRVFEELLRRSGEAPVDWT